MTEKRFKRISVCGDWGVKDIEKDKVLFFGTTDEVIDTVDLLNELADENERLKKENKLFKDKYERKDRALKRTKKDIEKYTDYFMRELNWDCDRIMREVFRW